MKIFLTEQIRYIDKYTIDNEPVKSIDLMERASLACFNWIKNKFSQDTIFKIFVGPGNNGGDGLAVARLLADENFNITVYVINITPNYSDDFKVNYERLNKQNKIKIFKILEECDFPVFNPCEIIIDAIFGSGLSRPIEGMVAKLIHNINKYDNTVISIDIPSGLFAEDNSRNIFDNIVKADFVLTFQFPKLVYMFPQAAEYAENFEALPIGLHKKIISEIETGYYYTILEDIKKILTTRRKFSHKGNFGHGLLISGSYGKSGAAVLASKSCLRTGIGLLTSHIPKSSYNILQISVPEAMVNTDNNEDYFSEIPDLSAYNAIGVGPGIGTNKQTSEAFYKLITTSKVPVVIDADAINILGQNKEWLDKIPAGSILTPHFKEFERIAGLVKNDYERIQLLIHFAKKYNIFIVLKGAYSAIACPDGKCYFNSTGNPGMATAGSGDVLTGMVLSLLSQGYSSQNSAILGVYLHGLAGDLAKEDMGEEALIASDIIDHIGDAYKFIKNEI